MDVRSFDDLPADVWCPEILSYCDKQTHYSIKQVSRQLYSYSNLFLFKQKDDRAIHATRALLRGWPFSKPLAPLDLDLILMAIQHPYFSDVDRALALIVVADQLGIELVIDQNMVESVRADMQNNPYSVRHTLNFLQAIAPLAGKAEMLENLSLIRLKRANTPNLDINISALTALRTFSKKADDAVMLSYLPLIEAVVMGPWSSSDVWKSRQDDAALATLSSFAMQLTPAALQSYLLLIVARLKRVIRLFNVDCATASYDLKNEMYSLLKMMEVFAVKLDDDSLGKLLPQVLSLLKAKELEIALVVSTILQAIAHRINPDDRKVYLSQFVKMLNIFHQSERAFVVVSALTKLAAQLSLNDIVDYLPLLEKDLDTTDLRILQIFFNQLTPTHVETYLPKVLDALRKGDLYVQSVALITLQSLNQPPSLIKSELELIVRKLPEYPNGSRLTGLEIIAMLVAGCNPVIVESFAEWLIRRMAATHRMYDDYLRLRHAFAILPTPGIIKYEMPDMLQCLSLYLSFEPIPMAMLDELQAFLLKLSPEAIAEYLPAIFSPRSSRENLTVPAILLSQAGLNILSYLIVSGKCTLEQLIAAGMKDDKGGTNCAPLLSTTAKWLEQIKATGKVPVSGFRLFDRVQTLKVETPSLAHGQMPLPVVSFYDI